MLRGKAELSPQDPREESEQIKGKEEILGFSSLQGFPAIAVWQKVNTGSHSPCAFDLLGFNSVFLDVPAWGKLKEREGERR